MAQDIITPADRIKFVQATLAVVNGKWKLPILMSMHQGVNRFRDLQRSVPTITTRVLSKELKDLEANNLVIRKVKEGKPVAVEYILAPYSASLTPVVSEMIKWGKQHHKTAKKH